MQLKRLAKQYKEDEGNRSIVEIEKSVNKSMRSLNPKTSMPSIDKGNTVDISQFDPVLKNKRVNHSHSRTLETDMGFFLPYVNERDNLGKLVDSNIKPTLK